MSMSRSMSIRTSSRSRLGTAAKAVSLSALLIMVCGAAHSASAFQVNGGQSAKSKATVSRAKSRITIDGLLDEPDWIEALSVGEILQRDPHPGEKASEKT